ncbi:MAG: GHKL domain-containing protein [Ignavibacteriae bacterium]|nr:GHKL domain-containing protein [Ignavibacteriota bacterium]
MNNGIVSTISHKCKRCYSCVRECPEKAIKVFEGQAIVLSNRCISCGHCVKVCSQEAKKIVSDIDNVLDFLIPNFNTIAIIAPAFAAAFPDNYFKIPNALKAIGFSKVIETAFGADLISQEYNNYWEGHHDKVVISSPCPAIVNFIEKYYADLVDNLAKIVSPMVATGRYLKDKFGNETKVIFIGPCVAKKSEYTDEEVNDAIDGVLTFTELKKIFALKNINLNDYEDSFFDPPYANMGKSYALSGGLLKTASLESDVLGKKIIVVDGKQKVEELIQDISEGKIKSSFVDILFCEGCISGPAIETDMNYYVRREKVIEYIEENITHVDKNIWKSEIYNSRNLNLKRNFKSKSQRIPMPNEASIKQILSSTNKITKQDELNCGACGYKTCREYAVNIAKGIAEKDMCLPFLIDKMEKAYDELKDTQAQLQNAEKLASIGQLAAGVAHEINNPLGTILLFASILKEDIENKTTKISNVEDVKMIIDETDRCKKIVSNLLNFARQGSLNIEKINICKTINDVIKSIKVNPKFSDVKLSFASTLPEEKFNFDRDQIKQVLINLITNACESTEDSSTKEVKIKVFISNNKLNIEINDTGTGIEEDNKSKLFVPFFTTKKIGKGTGLGLAISYGIVKMHKGNIEVKSKINEGSTFTVQLPIQQELKMNMSKELLICN